MLSKSRNIGKVLQSSMSSMTKLDPVQEALLTEPCILVNSKDEVLGSASKRECHEVSSGTSLLHRAFSLFVFNSRDELLLQQRSDTKITFPGLESRRIIHFFISISSTIWNEKQIIGLWTNTCCSHPLATPTELEEAGQLGVRTAAQRRLELELGVPHSQAQVQDIKFVTRILYEAESDSVWGEHELDYILMLRQSQLDVKPNSDEVKDIEWVAKDHLQEFLRDLESRNVGITPWFKLCTKVWKQISWNLVHRSIISLYRNCCLIGGKIYTD